MSSSLEILSIYDVDLNENEELDMRWMETVPNIKDAFSPLLDSLYDLLHKASLDEEKGSIHEIVEWLLDFYYFVVKIPDPVHLSGLEGTTDLSRIIQETHKIIAKEFDFLYSMNDKKSKENHENTGFD